MINLDNIKQVYFLGIGGIGMSALARYFKAGGMQVAGYDRTPTELTLLLEKEGIAIHYEDDTSLIPASYRSPAKYTGCFNPCCTIRSFGTGLVHISAFWHI